MTKKLAIEEGNLLMTIKKQLSMFAYTANKKIYVVSSYPQSPQQTLPSHESFAPPLRIELPNPFPPPLDTSTTALVSFP